jgi:hypothetical protein
LRAVRRAGPRVAGRVGEGVSEFVGVLREDEERVAGRSRSPMPPTQAAIRWSLPLTRPLTLADLRWTGGSLTHVGQPRKHGAQAVKQSQQSQDLRLWGEVEDQHALQRGRGSGRIASPAERERPPTEGRRVRGRPSPAACPFLTWRTPLPALSPTGRGFRKRIAVVTLKAVVPEALFPLARRRGATTCRAETHPTRSETGRTDRKFAPGRSRCVM